MAEIVMIGGPNGAGKTTPAMALLPDHLKITEFVNADSIAAGISPFNPNANALLAGRLMLDRIRTLMEQRTSFAFETTMASRVFSLLLDKWKSSGNLVRGIFVFVNDPMISVSRVNIRSLMGGQFIDEEIIKRRYRRGIQNFFNLYLPLADEWSCYDNSSDGPLLVASGGLAKETSILQFEDWKGLQSWKEQLE
jgi:predicted ABC-type ATPase